MVSSLKRCPVSNSPGFELPPLDDVVVVKVPVGFWIVRLPLPAAAAEVSSTSVPSSVFAVPSFALSLHFLAVPVPK